MDYWEECIREAFEDAKITATTEQIKNVAEWVEGAHDNYSLGTGLDVIQSNHRPASEIELDKLKATIKKDETWRRSTEPCRDCNTTGIVLDGWGRSVECDSCRGKGKKIMSDG